MGLKMTTEMPANTMNATTVILIHPNTFWIMIPPLRNRTCMNDGHCHDKPCGTDSLRRVRSGDFQRKQHVFAKYDAVADCKTQECGLHSDDCR